MNVINFSDRNFRMLYEGKISTVRMGIKPRIAGEFVHLQNEQTGVKIEAAIRDVEYIRIVDLTVEHAENDGFESVSSLICELEKCYDRRVNARDRITVITFEFSAKGLVYD